MKKENYNASLRDGKLTDKYVKEILGVFEKPLRYKELEAQEKKSLNISKHLARFPLYIISGNKSWQGLAIGFPGNTADLTTGNVGTPFLRMLLYPILEAFQAVSEKYFNGNANCLYFMGVRFPDVFLRKFTLISATIPHLIILTNDLAKTIRLDIPKIIGTRKNEHSESYLQANLCSLMHEDELVIPDGRKPFKIKHISYEVQTVEGTEKPERLDILGYDVEDGSLVAFEIKGECGDNEFNNLFTQGMEHRNWLEENKMAIKLITEGSNGSKIDTTKRVKLVLGACRETVPSIFRQLKEAALKKDKYMQISFVQIIKENGKVRLNPISYESNNPSRNA